MTQEALSIGSAPVSVFIIANMKLAINPQDMVSLALFNSFVNAPTLNQPISVDDQRLLQEIKTASPEVAFNRIVKYYELDSAESDIAYIQALHEQIGLFCSSRVADLMLFLRWWDDSGHKTPISVEQNTNSIEVTTIHKSKGLERRAVIIPYCTWSLDPMISTGRVNNFVWVDNQVPHFAKIGSMPVKYSKAVAGSYFSADYYREMVYSHVDNINLLYVAVTRAKESLTIMMPTQKRDKNGKLRSFGVGTVGDLIRTLMSDSDGVAQIGDMTTTSVEEFTGGYKQLRFGELRLPERTEQPPQHTKRIVFTDYPTSELNESLKIKLKLERYFQDEEQVELSPQSYGIIMHKAFENATTLDDVTTAIRSMQINGELSLEEEQKIGQIIARAMTSEQISSWFSGEWRHVRNENQIIMPNGETSRRPDRVMIDGSRVVIVDYKFGQNQDTKHSKQVVSYAEILRQMGYGDIQGFLWYVSREEVVRVV